jgi:hypothetical protein
VQTEGKRMIGTENGYFDEMVRKGLISTGGAWIRRAIEQKHPKLPIAVADSRVLTYDILDRNIVNLKNYN